MTLSSNWRKRALTVAAGLYRLCDRLGAKRLARSLRLAIAESAWGGLDRHEEVTDLLGALQERDRLRFLHVAVAGPVPAGSHPQRSVARRPAARRHGTTPDQHGDRIVIRQPAL